MKNDSGFLERQSKWKNINEGFDYLYIVLLIHAHALDKIRQVK